MSLASFCEFCGVLWGITKTECGFGSPDVIVIRSEGGLEED